MTREDKQGLSLYKRIKAPPAEALTYTTKAVTEGNTQVTKYIAEPDEVDEVVRQRFLG